VSLYRVGKVWYLDIPTAKGRLRASTRTADKRQAQEYHDKVKAGVWRQEKLNEAPPITWGEAVEKWLKSSPRGLPDRYRLNTLKMDLSASLPLSSYITENLFQGLTGSTFNRTRALVLAIHSCAGVSPPKIDRARETPSRTRWLSSSEWTKLKRALEKESPLLAQCARFAVATGLRENNVLELRWDQVIGTRIVLEASETKQKTALGIPLSPDAQAVLDERRGLHKVYVFAHPDSGKPLTKASNRAWYKARKDAGLMDVRWHDLRHTWASWAVQSGLTLQEVMQLGGWKTYQMVLRYSHLSTDHLADAASRVRPIKR